MMCPEICVPNSSNVFLYFSLQDLYLKFVWNNFLHTQVESCISNILSIVPAEPSDGQKSQVTLVHQVRNLCLNP